MAPECPRRTSEEVAFPALAREASDKAELQDTFTQVGIMSSRTENQGLAGAEPLSYGHQALCAISCAPCWLQQRWQKGRWWRLCRHHEG